MRNAGIEYEEHDYGKTGLTAEVVSELVAKAGGVAAVLNTRHAIAKERGWAAAPPAVKEFAAAVVKDMNLIRRPILIDGKQVVVGFDREKYAAITKQK